MAASETTTPKEQKTRKSKRVFFASLLDLSWKMLGAMLIPIAIGMYADDKLFSGQRYTLVGFFVGMILGVLVIRSVVVKISKEEAR